MKVARKADRAVTLRDVARQCGLSVYPVSRALNGKAGVTPETVAKVKAVAAALGYDPSVNHAARQLALRKSGATPLNHVVGLLLPGQLGKVCFFYELFRGITEELSAGGFGLLMIPTYDPVAHHALPVELPPSVWRGEVDGLIVHQTLDQTQLDRLRHKQGFGVRPVISLVGRMAGCPAVLRDERDGARQGLAHLLALGHRRVLYMRKRATGYPVSDREAGYDDACAAAGLAMADCLHPVLIDHDHEVEAPLRAALGNNPDATALLTLNDPNARHACYVLQRVGKRVPESFSLVGWDDTDPLPDAHGQNLLTSVAFDIAEMGRVAARMLIAAVEQPGVMPATVTMPAQLVVRGSTAPPPIENHNA